MSTVVEKRDLTAEVVAVAPQGQTNYIALRKAGLDALLALKLPGNKTEEYRFTPITRVLEKTFAQWPSSTSENSSVTSIDAYLIPGLDANVAVILNGKFSPTLSRLSNDAYSVTSLASEKSPVFENLVGKQVDTTADAFAAMNAALWQDGLAIHVTGESKKSLVILNINDGSKPQAVHNRLAVIVEKGASVSLIERTVTLGKQPVFVTLSEEISIGKNAKLNYCKIQNDTNIIQVCNTFVSQLNTSHVNTFTLTLDGTLIRNNLSIAIDGENCESHFNGLSLLKGDTIGDHHTVVDHKKPNSFSNELYKGVMDGKSKGVFNGKIYVRPHAQKTNAFQSNRNILLTDQSTINTKPQLEIWADDVKCSHGCTTGQLDDDAMFYLQSRGIGKDDARALLLYAFASQTTDLITIEPLRAYIDSLVTQRLYGSN